MSSSRTATDNAALKPIKPETSMPRKRRQQDQLDESTRFGLLLKAYRLQAELTQQSLAKRAGYSIVYISKLEQGRRVPYPNIVTKLAEILQLDVSERVALELAAQHVRRLHRKSSSTQEQLALPLVGRVSEIELLSRHLAGEGSPVVMLVGKPGIGKSRLLIEATRIGQERGWCVLRGDCHTASGQEPFAPIMGMVEGWLDHLRDNAPERFRLSLRRCSHLVRFLPELAKSGALAEPTFTLLPHQERRLMFDAVRQFLANVAGPCGTLLVLDDLQWAGDDTLKLLKSLVFSSHAPSLAPLRMVCAYRDTEKSTSRTFEQFLDDLIHHNYITHRSLGPLDEADARLLVEQIIGDALPAGDGRIQRLDAMVRQAGGVPFYLESFAKEAKAHPEVIELPDASQPGIPSDIERSVRRRIATLPRNARDLLHVVVVAGRSIPWTLLSTITERMNWKLDDVLSALDVACASGLLESDTSDGLVWHRVEHDLVREVILAGLNPARRLVLHRRTAEALELQPGMPQVEQIAYHFARSDAMDKALTYLKLAARHAHAVYANADAVAYYRELAKRLERLGLTHEVAHAHTSMGAILRTMSHYGDALTWLERAIETYQAVRDWEGLATATAEIVLLHQQRGTTQEGGVRLQTVLDAIGSDAPPDAVANLLVAQADLYWLEAMHHEHVLAAEQGVKLSRSASEFIQARVSLRWGAALAMGGHFAEAIPILEQAISLVEAKNDLWSAGYALENLSTVREAYGAFDAAKADIERAIRLATRIGDNWALTWMTTRRGMNSVYRGDWSQAQTDYERAITISRHIEVSSPVSYPLFALSQLCLARGQREAAIQYQREAIEAIQGSPPRILRPVQGKIAEFELLEGHADAARARLEALFTSTGHEEDLIATSLLPLLAWAYHDLGEREHAEETVKHAITHATQEGNALALVDARRVYALITLTSGRLPEALQSIEAALAACRAMPYPYGEVKMLYTYACLHHAQHDYQAARECCLTALTLCERLSERLYAERIEKLLADTISS